MNELLFHSSWWLMACIAAGGIVAFIAGNRRLDKNLQRIGLAVLALAAILGLLRFFFPTARERMEIRSRAIVKAVDHQDWNALSSLLDPDTAVCSPSRVLKGGRDQIVAATREVVDSLQVKSISVLSIESVQTETLITVSLEIYSVQEDTQGRPVTSSWQMEYEQSGNQWILQKITVLRVGNETGEDFNPRLPAPLD
jgi:hypothetical protein